MKLDRCVFCFGRRNFIEPFEPDSDCDTSSGDTSDAASEFSHDSSMFEPISEASEASDEKCYLLGTSFKLQNVNFIEVQDLKPGYRLLGHRDVLVTVEDIAEHPTDGKTFIFLDAGHEPPIPLTEDHRVVVPRGPNNELETIRCEESRRHPEDPVDTVLFDSGERRLRSARRLIVRNSYMYDIKFSPDAPIHCYWIGQEGLLHQRQKSKTLVGNNRRWIAKCDRVIQFSDEWAEDLRIKYARVMATAPNTTATLGVCDCFGELTNGTAAVELYPIPDPSQFPLTLKLLSLYQVPINYSLGWSDELNAKYKASARSGLEVRVIDQAVGWHRSPSPSARPRTVSFDFSVVHVAGI